MTQEMQNKINNNLVGTKCIIRTKDAGVWYATIDELDDTLVLMNEARRLYYWKCLDDGITLSHIAIGGIHPESKIQAPINMSVVQWIEILPASEACIATMDMQGYAKAE